MAQLVLPHHASQGLNTPQLNNKKAKKGTKNSEARFEIQLNFMLQKSKYNFKAQQILKRIFDVVIASIGLISISPLLLGIALAIRLDSKGPVFYLSDRIGKDYKPFKMYKFRTMRTDADALRDTLREEADLKGELFKIENDPRVTQLGTFLRATSLDELPQLFNVILGNMSLVGPRPLPPDESELFKEPYTLRYQVIPGITGMWQVNGRSTSNFQQLCELEMLYLNDWNLWEDIKLLFQTFPAVLTSRGAC